jgi:serine/threonine-protein kinase RIM15
MWVFRPYTGPHQTPAVDFDDVALVEALGVGAQNLDRYLQTLGEGNVTDPSQYPAPQPVLCHICDREIQPWFFERHSELCFVTHEAESMVNECQDNLRDHRQVLEEFTNMFEDALHRKDWDFCCEYRGVTIVQPIKQPPAPTPPHRSLVQPHHPTFPQSPFRKRPDPSKQQSLRLLSLLEDLCNIALEISRPSIKDDDPNIPIEEMRLQSPTSESRMVQIIDWQSPTPEEEGLALLCQDTLTLAQTKVDAVNRLRNVIIYAERIRQEINVKVEEMIQNVTDKAKLASAEQSSDSEDYETSEDQQHSLEPTPEVEEESHTPLDERSEPQYPEIMAVRSITAKRRLGSSLTDDSSGGSVSPRQSPTPRTFSPFKPTRISANLDEGNESDASIKSGRSVPGSSKDRLDLPDAIEFGPRLGRKPSLYGSPRRQSSPARRQISPSRHFSPSPLKPQPHRLSIAETSPLGSPVFINNEGQQDWAKNHLRHLSSHSDQLRSDQLRQVPLSPRMPSVSAATRPAPPSIKDFDVIKPISKGAFGSVYLTKKKSTGDYFAIKVLKKADMIVKNQVTNVRAERAILMAQGESPFVAKLFFTFQSKDYLYLVMEYLNGGDCAALVKNMIRLQEPWAKKYIAEVVLGVEYLHEHGIIHR